MDETTEKETIIIAMLRFFENIMSSDPSEHVGVSINLEGQAIAAGNPYFPDGWMAFHLLHAERGMLGVFQQILYLFIDLPLQMFGKIMIIPNKGFREGYLHFFFRAVRASTNVSKGPAISPSAMALSASCSRACHSLVQNHS